MGGGKLWHRDQFLPVPSPVPVGTDIATGVGRLAEYHIKRQVDTHFEVEYADLPVRILFGQTAGQAVQCRMGGVDHVVRQDGLGVACDQGPGELSDAVVEGEQRLDQPEHRQHALFASPR